MTTLDSIKSAIMVRKDELHRRYRVKNIAVFGSFARGEARPDSDVDLLVEFDGPVGVEFIDLAEQLESILQRRVDLVSREGIKPKYFDAISPDLKYV
jgi:uncharacterized protein